MSELSKNEQRRIDRMERRLLETIRALSKEQDRSIALETRVGNLEKLAEFRRGPTLERVNQEAQARLMEIAEGKGKELAKEYMSRREREGDFGGWTEEERRRIPRC